MGWMLFRLVFSLAFVALVLLWAARIAKKRGLGRGGQLIEVLSRQQMSRTSNVNVIKVADRVFLIGATDSQVSLLAEMDAEAIEAALPDPVPGTVGPVSARPISTGLLAGSVFDRAQWAALLDGLREKTVRRS